MAKFHRNKADGKIMGVCAGFADMLGIEALWVRVATVALAVFATHWIVPVYFIIGLLAPVRQPLVGWDAMDDGHDLARWRRRQGASMSVDSGLSDIEQRVSDMERKARGDSWPA
ncbi:MAG: PspC domain-containing protein [Sphingomonadales bacterium]|nr:PspC domain-containing protein [Sphingomonadales bacterium]